MRPFSKLKPMKVLVGAPTNEIKNYCLDKYLATITNLLYPKNLYDIMIVDNSESRDNTKKIIQMGVNCVHVKPKDKSNQEYIAESQELLRLAALKGNYDYLVMIESDIIPPLYAIHSLLSHQKQVVGGYYMTGHGEDSFPMVQLVEQNGSLIRHTLNSSSKHGILNANGKLQEVHNMGFGCIAIHKSVLQNIKFRVEKGSDSHSDSFFAADLNFLGIKQYQDTSLVCDHLNSNWSEVVDFQKA